MKRPSTFVFPSTIHVIMRKRTEYPASGSCAPAWHPSIQAFDCVMYPSGRAAPTMDDAAVILTILAVSSAAILFWLRALRGKRDALTNLAVDAFGPNPPVVPVVVPEAQVIEGNVFPLTLSPSAHAGPAERVAFIQKHRIALMELLHNHGAVLLRGWGPCDAQHFAQVAALLELEETEMSCSAGPRFEVAPRVFTANEAPPTERIPFHHEMAQCDLPPSVVLFFCEVAPTQGGTTPILQSHLAATYLRTHHPLVAARIADMGVRYVRIMPPVTDPSSALGKSWKNALRVETVPEAEAKLRALGSTWTWLPGEMLHTVTGSMPALIVDNRTGREVFFTAAETTFNAIDDELLSKDGGVVPAEEVTAKSIRPTKSIIYGDGSPLDRQTKEALVDTSAFMRRRQVAVPWQPGDVLLLDNATVQHSRENFTPPRRILASLAGRLSKVGGLHTVDRVESCSKELSGFSAGFSVSPSSTMDGLPSSTMDGLAMDGVLKECAPRVHLSGSVI